MKPSTGNAKDTTKNKLVGSFQSVTSKLQSVATSTTSALHLTKSKPTATAAATTATTNSGTRTSDLDNGEDESLRSSMMTPEKRRGSNNSIDKSEDSIERKSHSSDLIGVKAGAGMIIGSTLAIANAAVSTAKSVGSGVIAGVSSSSSANKKINRPQTPEPVPIPPHFHARLSTIQHGYPGDEVYLLNPEMRWVMETNQMLDELNEKDKEFIENMKKERRMVLLALDEAFRAEGFTDLSSYKIELPQCEDPGKPYLFRDPLQIMSNELYILAFQPNGMRRELSKNQFDMIETFRRFDVESLAFPGFTHTWEISEDVLLGRDAIERNFDEDLASSDKLWSVDIKEYIKSTKPNAFSLQNSVIYTENGFIQLGRVFYGLKEHNIIFTPIAEIEKVTEEAEKKYVINELKLADPDGEMYDLRLFNPELTSKTAAIVNRIKEEADKYWKDDLNERDIGILEDVERRNPPLKLPQYRFSPIIGGIIPPTKTETLVQSRREELKKDDLEIRYQLDSELQHIAPGYGVLLSNKIKAKRIREKCKIQLEESLKAKKDDYIAKVKTQNAAVIAQIPDKNQAEEWIQEQFRATYGEEYKTFEKEEIAKNNLEIIQTMKETGLELNAKIFELHQRFKQEEAPKIFERMYRKEVPTKRFTVAKRIWSAKSWKVERVLQRGNRMAFVAYKNDVWSFASDTPGWRLKLLWYNFLATTNNTAFRIMDSFTNGRFGLKAMFSCSNKYYRKKKINLVTGEVMNDPKSATRTAIGRIVKAWDDAKTLPDTQPSVVNAAVSILSSAISRDAQNNSRTVSSQVGLFGVRTASSTIMAQQQSRNTTLHGILQVAKATTLTFVVVVLFPVAFCLNFVFSLIFFLLSPVYAFLKELARFFIWIFVYDRYGDQMHSELSKKVHQRSWFPFFNVIFVDMLLFGLFQLIFASLWIFFLALFGSLALYFWAYSKYYYNLTSDSIVFSRKILGKARVPASDSKEAKRISGPDMLPKFIYQITPGVAGLALQVAIQRDELRIRHANALSFLKDHKKKHIDFFNSILQPVAKIDNHENEIMKQVIMECDLIENELKEQVRLRNALLDQRIRLPQFPTKTYSCRMKEKDLLSTLKSAERFTKVYYEKKLLKLLTVEQTQKYWIKKNILPGKYGKLAIYYLTSMLGEEILNPLPEELCVDQIKQSLLEIESSKFNSNQVAATANYDIKPEPLNYQLPIEKSIPKPSDDIENDAESEKQSTESPAISSPEAAVDQNREASTAAMQEEIKPLDISVVKVPEESKPAPVTAPEAKVNEIAVDIQAIKQKESIIEEKKAEPVKENEKRNGEDSNKENQEKGDGDNNNNEEDEEEEEDTLQEEKLPVILVKDETLDEIYDYLPD